MKPADLNAPLADTDPMPSGPHRGTPLANVPASYLHRRWITGGDADRVADYIRRHLGKLKKEWPDGLW